MKRPHKLPKQDNPKARAAQLQQEWEALLARHSKPLERGAKSFGIKRVPEVRQAPQSSSVAMNRVSSNPNGMMGLATKAAPKIYTGNCVMGIAVMHKSNMVPIFNSESAVEVAKMRRG
jgi:hypothetical protein